MVTFAIAATTLILWLGNEPGNEPGTRLLMMFIPAEVFPSDRHFFSYVPFYLTLTMWMFIMLSILIEDIRCAQQNVLKLFVGMTRKRVIQCCRVFLLLLSLFGGLASLLAFAFNELVLVSIFSTSAAIYFALSIMVCSITIRHGNVF